MIGNEKPISGDGGSITWCLAHPDEGLTEPEPMPECEKMLARIVLTQLGMRSQPPKC